jgi:hypothetical protein
VRANYLREFCDYWGKGYNWRNAEQKLNQLAHYQTEIDDIGIHFVCALCTASSAVLADSIHARDAQLTWGEYHVLYGDLTMLPASPQFMFEGLS